MKKGGGILLLILMVSTQTPVGQLFKLPALVQHFTKHQALDGVSFLDFLAEHYATEHEDADQQEDEKLPFKNILLFNIGYAVVASALQANVFDPLRTEKKIIFSPNYIPQQHLASIFHPPRM